VRIAALSKLKAEITVVGSLGGKLEERCIPRKGYAGVFSSQSAL
jgi:hypothetical protein